jgi:hypothetical protein
LHFLYSQGCWLFLHPLDCFCICISRAYLIFVKWCFHHFTKFSAIIYSSIIPTLFSLLFSSKVPLVIHVVLCDLLSVSFYYTPLALSYVHSLQLFCSSLILFYYAPSLIDYIVIISFHFLFFCFVYCAGNQTQGLAHARQAFYHWPMSPSL